MSVTNNSKYIMCFDNKLSATKGIFSRRQPYSKGQLKNIDCNRNCMPPNYKVLDFKGQN